MGGEDHGVEITTPADYPDPSIARSDGYEAAGAEPSVAATPTTKEAVPRCPEGSSFLGNKNRQLASLAAKFGAAASEMLLLDDDAHNIKEAQKAGVMALHTPSGLTK